MLRFPKHAKKRRSSGGAKHAPRLAMASRKDIRRGLKKQAIINAAIEVLSERGINEVTLDHIAEKIGLTKASLYYYYKSKDQVVADVLERVLEHINEQFEKRASEVKGPLELLKLRAFIHVVTAVQSPAGRLITSNLDALTENKDAAVLLRKHEDPARDLLKQAMGSKILRRVDVTCATKLLFGAINNIPRWYSKQSGSLEDVFEQTWDIFLNGVR